MQTLLSPDIVELLVRERLQSAANDALADVRAGCPALGLRHPTPVPTRAEAGARRARIADRLVAIAAWVDSRRPAHLQAGQRTTNVLRNDFIRRNRNV